MTYPYFFLDTGHYFQDFEGLKENNEYGSRTSSVRPFCGRQSLELHSSWLYLYKAGLSKKSGALYKQFDLRTFNKVKFILHFLCYDF